MYSFTKIIAVTIKHVEKAIIVIVILNCLHHLQHTVQAQNEISNRKLCDRPSQCGVSGTCVNGTCECLLGYNRAESGFCKVYTCQSTTGCLKYDGWQFSTCINNLCQCYNDYQLSIDGRTCRLKERALELDPESPWLWIGITFGCVIFIILLSSYLYYLIYRYKASRDSYFLETSTTARNIETISEHIPEDDNDGNVLLTYRPFGGYAEFVELPTSLQLQRHVVRQQHRNLEHQLSRELSQHKISPETETNNSPITIVVHPPDNPPVND